MIKVNNMNDTDGDVNTVKAELFADTKDEVVPGATIVGLPKNFTLEMGSTVITADGDVAFLKSDGTWSWV